MAEIRYAKRPVVHLYDPDDLETRKKQLLWGDWLRIGNDIDAGWSEVAWGRQKQPTRDDCSRRGSVKTPGRVAGSTGCCRRWLRNLTATTKSDLSRSAERFSMSCSSAM